MVETVDRDRFKMAPWALISGWFKLLLILWQMKMMECTLLYCRLGGCRDWRRDKEVHSQRVSLHDSRSQRRRKE